MENHRSPVPFFRLLFPLLAGILVAYYFAVSLASNWVLLILAGSFSLCIVLFVLLFLGKNTALYSKIFILICDVFLFVFSYSNTSAILQERASVSAFQERKVSLMLLVADKPAVKNNYSRVVSSLAQAYPEYNLKKGTKLIAWFPIDSVVEKSKPGDLLEVMGKLSTIKASGNPNSFNYQEYMALSQVYLQFKAIKGQTRIIGEERYNLKLKALQWRDNLLHVFEARGMGRQEMAVLAALTVGYKDEIDSGLKQAYSTTGIMHLMAVSGMHVGLIYLIATFLLKGFDKKKVFKILKVLLILVLIWFYVLLTGMTASVLRAGVMLSVVLVGDVFVKKPNIFNTMAVAAFVLLVADPLLIFNAGFQLSFLAVLSIVVFYQPIYRWLDTDNWMVDKIWSLAAVSIAAQILTLPLSLYLFGQFPNYFIVSNVVVVPVATLLIYGSIVLFLISPIVFLANWLAFLLGELTKGMNLFILFLEKMPWALTENIVFNQFQTFALYVFILGLAYYLFHKTFKSLLVALLSLGIIFSLNLYYKYKASTIKELAVWDVPGKSFYQIVNDASTLVLTDATEQKAAMLLKKWAAAHYCRNVALGGMDFNFQDSLVLKAYAKLSNNLLVSKKTVSLFLTDNRFKDLDVQNSFPVDNLVVSRSAGYYPDRLLKIFKPKKIILDSSVTGKQADVWKKTALVMGISLHSVCESGYISVSL